jgi:CubicO group peptidase (beta-lactamase class C family)
VLLAKDGKPIFEKAYGMASKSYGAANRTDTKFNLGSIDKVFTKVAIGQLIQQGKIASIDDKLIKYLPDYANKEAAEKITLRQIVNMQSGIGDFFGPTFEKTAKDQFRTISDYLPLFTPEPLQFEPGTKQKYSNGGYIVLGAVIEKLTGKTYYDYVRENIFQPLGMDDTDFSRVDGKSIATGQGLLRSAARWRPWRGGEHLYAAARGLVGGRRLLHGARPTDSRMLCGNRILNPAFDPGAPVARENHSRDHAGPGHLPEAHRMNGVINRHAWWILMIILSNYHPPTAQDVAGSVREFMGLRMD